MGAHRRVVSVINIEVEKHFGNALVIAAFEGWNDAGEAASEAVSHLLVDWRATLLASVDPEDYYDFQVNRPHVGFDADGTRELSWRTTNIWSCQAGPAHRDVILVTGIEPNLKWRTFCTELLDYLSDLGATTVVTLGALLADVPHTRPIPVNGISSNPDLAERFGLAPSRYAGPTGIVGVIQEAAHRREIETMSFWAAVPHYVAQAPAPKATLALLGQLEDLVGVPIDMGALPEEAKAWQRGVDELASDDSDVAEYVRALEEERDTADLPEASGDAIAREFERYLKRRSDEK
ncbi:MAG: PAC2 family protein [Propionibacteriales bacterium]|nr:PAC2 family protein [Propionibacteriales bacterium]